MALKTSGYDNHSNTTNNCNIKLQCRPQLSVDGAEFVLLLVSTKERKKKYNNYIGFFSQPMKFDNVTDKHIY